MNERAAKEYLLKNDSQFRQLNDEHQAFERKLAKLMEKPFLTSDEQLEETVIKKKKLVLKDQMQALIQSYQAEKSIN